MDSFSSIVEVVMLINILVALVGGLLLWIISALENSDLLRDGVTESSILGMIGFFGVQVTLAVIAGFGLAVYACVNQILATL